MEKLISTGPEKVIFLDIDGEDMVKRLAYIARKTGEPAVLKGTFGEPDKNED